MSIAPFSKLFGVLKSCVFALSSCDSCFRVCEVLLFQKTTNAENLFFVFKKHILRVCRKNGNGGFEIKVGYGQIYKIMTSYIFSLVTLPHSKVQPNFWLLGVKTTICVNIALCRNTIPLLIR